MMCRAEVTGSLEPTVAKQIQSVEPERRGNQPSVCIMQKRAERNLNRIIMREKLMLTYICRLGCVVYIDVRLGG